MASLPKTGTVTYEEWLRLPEVDEAIEEVVNGEIRIMPPNKWNHAIIIENLRDALAPRLDKRNARVVVAAFGLVIRKSPVTTRVPDLAVFDLATLVEQDGYIHSAPQLAVEVLCPANTRARLTEKLADYASLGVPEVWLVSPEAATVEILLQENGRLTRSSILADGTLTPRSFPSVRIPIAEIWPA